MPSFHEYMMRHGETGVQALLEQIERHENIQYIEPVCLEKRWRAAMEPVLSSYQMAA